MSGIPNGPNMENEEFLIVHTDFFGTEPVPYGKPSRFKFGPEGRNSRIQNFDSNVNLASVESQLIDDINSQISQDVINKLLTNW